MIGAGGDSTMSQNCIAKSYSIPQAMVAAVKNHAKETGLKEATIVQQALRNYLGLKEGDDSTNAKA
jgi:hypothetical protein